MEIISKPSNLITFVYFTRLPTTSLLLLTIPALEFLFWLIYFKYFINYYAWYDKWAVSHLKPCLLTNIFHPDRPYGGGGGVCTWVLMYTCASMMIWSPLKLQEQDWRGGMWLGSLQVFPDQSSVLLISEKCRNPWWAQVKLHTPRWRAWGPGIILVSLGFRG